MPSGLTPAAPLELGLIVNPIAGIGGPAALKGSDGEAIQALARARGVHARALARCDEFLAALELGAVTVRWHTWAGAMGEDALRARAITPSVHGRAVADPSNGEDTARAAATLANHVDLLVFVGGDGTARDVCGAVSETQLLLGVPAGVKMHSGVFAISPVAAARVVSGLAAGGLTSAVEVDVRDVDEARLRRNQTGSRFYGTARVPATAGFLQHTKEAGRESDALVHVEIGADLADHASPGVAYLVGPGTTMLAVKRALLATPAAADELTLLGVDVIRDGELVASDADEQTLWQLVSTTRCRAVLAPTGGQGFLIGRGNQQFSPRVLTRLTRDGCDFAATRSKLLALGGRPLLIDSGDATLDARWSGIIELVSGYQDRLLYRLAHDAGEVTA